MSEFSVIVKIVSGLITATINRVLDIISIFMLVCSFILPWRFVEFFELRNLRASCIDVRFTLALLIMTCCDVLIIPISVLCAISPARFYQVFLILRDYYFVTTISYSRYRKSRWLIVESFHSALIDTFSLPFLILCILSPTGRGFLLSKFNLFQGLDQSNVKVFSGHYDHFSYLIIGTGCKVLLDLLIISLALCSFIVPTIWPCLLKGFVELSRNRDNDHTYEQFAYYEKSIDQWHSQFRAHILNQIPHAVIDLLVFPCFLLAAVSPMRTRSFFTEMFDLKSENDRRLSELVLPVGSFDYRYDIDIRKHIFYAGCLSIGDVVMCPMLLLLFITQYRYRGISKDLSWASSWGFDELKLVSYHFFLLITDTVILLPTVPILFLTRIRWPEINKVLNEENVFVDKSWTLYYTAIFQFFLMVRIIVLDILFAPLTAVVQCVKYRNSSVRELLAREVPFHLVILFNFSIIIHDIFIMPFFVILFCALGIHRSPHILNLYLEFCNSRNDALNMPRNDSTIDNTALGYDGIDPTDRIPGTTLPTGNESDLEIVSNGPSSSNKFSSGDETESPGVQDSMSDLDIDSKPNSFNENSNRGSQPTSYQSDNSKTQGGVPVFANESSGSRMNVEDLDIRLQIRDFRWLLWYQFFSILLDIPFLVLGIIVQVTLWRSSELWNDGKEFFISANWDLNVVADRDWEIRGHIFIHFISLIRDIVFVIPFSTVLCTLYRFPQLVTELRNKITNKPLSTNPVFEILSCDCVFPEIGSPSLNFKLVASLPELAKLEILKSYPVEMHVIGENFWADCSDVHGAGITSVIRSLLPLKFDDGKNINISELIDAIDQKNMEEKTTEIKLHQQPLDLMIRIDTGETKRKIIIRKLNKLPRGAKITIQCEAYAGTTELDNTKRIKKIVLLRFSLTVQDILNLLIAGGGSMPLSCCNVPIDVSPHEFSSRSNNFVNSFYIVVGKVFFECILDILYFIQFVLVLVSPMRFLRLLYALFEHESYLAYRICESCHRSISHADYHILEYRNQIAPTLNLYSKQWVSTFLLAGYSDSISLSHMGSDPNSHFYQRVEKLHIGNYRKLMTNSLKILQSVSGCENLTNLVRIRSDLHERIIKLWFVKTFAANQLLHAHVEADKYSLIYVALTEEQEKIAVLLGKNNSRMREAVKSVKESSDLRANKKKKTVGGLLSKIGLLTRPINESRRLIGMSCVQAFADVGFAIIMFLLIFSVIWTIPLCKDLFRHKTFSTSRYTTRYVLQTHAMNAYQNVIQITEFLFYTSVIFATIFETPDFLSNLISHLGSLSDATNCAKRHFGMIAGSFCSFLAIITSIRTYRVFFRAFMYAFLVPAACLAEASPFSFFGTGQKFLIGILVWIGLLAGSIRVSQIANLSGEGVGVGDSLMTSNLSSISLFVLSASLFGVLTISAISVFVRPTYHSPSSQGVKFLDLSWGHIFAILTGPLESLQLSAVVMYFYWNNGDSNDFPSRILMWDSHGGQNGFYVSSSIACVAVIVLGVLVAVPLAAVGDESRRQHKVLAIKNSDLYEAAMIFSTRLFSVWIMVTLMRSSSCISISVIPSQGQMENAISLSVLSTDSSVVCGGDSYWAAYLSVPLLAFYMITSSVLHADDADLLKSPSSHGDKSVVRFSPLYALSTRTCQFFICAACLSTRWVEQTTTAITVLAPILAISALMAALPLIFKVNACSSLAMVTPLRSAGSVCVLWTSIVCLLRHLNISTSVFETTESIWYGWLAIYFLSTLFVAWTEYETNRHWIEQLKISGLDYEVENFLITCETLFVEEAIRQNYNLLNFRTRFDGFKSAALKARSVSQLARVVLSLERDIMVDRLNLNFLRSRQQWIESLQNISDQMVYDGIIDEVVHESAGDLESHPPDSIARVNADKRGIIQSHSFVCLPCSARRYTDIHQFPALTIMRKAASALAEGILPLPMVIKSSKHIMGLLLSRRFPLEICWHIMGYFVNMTKIKDLLFNEDTEWTNNPILLSRGETTSQLFYFSAEYFSRRLPALRVRDAVVNDNKDFIDLQMQITKLSQVKPMTELYYADLVKSENNINNENSDLDGGNKVHQILVYSNVPDIIQFSNNYDTRSSFAESDKKTTSTCGAGTVDMEEKIGDNNHVVILNNSSQKRFNPFSSRSNTMKSVEKNSTSSLSNEKSLQLSDVRLTDRLDKIAPDDIESNKASEAVSTTIQYPNGDIYNGETLTGIRHGLGKMTYIDGSSYEGYFFQNKKNGFGKSITSKGDIYEGEYRDDLKNGQGVNKYITGDVYSGEYLDDKKHGHAILKRKDGSIYEGSYRDGKVDGFGSLLYSNGSKFEGDWVKGRKQGSGIFSYTNGDSYDGQWYRDTKHGSGSFVHASGEKYKGNWINNNKSGTGEITFTDGSVYFGELMDGKIQGKGVWKTPNGEEYCGEWADNKRHGVGEWKDATGSVCKGLWKQGVRDNSWVCIHSNGDCYEGSYRSNARHGKGKFLYANGDCYDGDWNDDLKSGFGVFTYANGSYFRGNWDQGMKNGYGVESYYSEDVNSSSDSIKSSKKSLDLFEGNFRNNLKHGFGKLITAKGDTFEGHYVDGIKNGEGKYIFANGDTYTGGWVAGLMEGNGILTYSNAGEFYKGAWVAGKWHGLGFYKFSGGGTYEGEFLDGIRHGNAISRYSDGAMFKGEFRDNKRHYGEYTSPNGDVYVGEFLNDFRHGQGKLTSLKGDEYSGLWENGKQHGQGTLTFENGNSYAGQWTMGEMEGFGVFKYSSGDSYEGQMRDGRFDGIGKLTHFNGDEYSGQWRGFKSHGIGSYSMSGDVFHGHWVDGVFKTGSCTYRNGDSFEGQWDEGMPHGKGKMTFANGGFYDGEWKSGKMHGAGTRKFGNGDAFEGQWVEGKQIGRNVRKYQFNSSGQSPIVPDESKDSPNSWVKK